VTVPAQKAESMVRKGYGEIVKPKPPKQPEAAVQEPVSLSDKGPVAETADTAPPEETADVRPRIRRKDK
jgi:hypothetical protein